MFSLQVKPSAKHLFSSRLQLESGGDLHHHKGLRKLRLQLLFSAESMKLVPNELQLSVLLKILDAVPLEVIQDSICHGSSVLGFPKLNFELETNVSYDVCFIYYDFYAIVAYVQLVVKQQIILSLLLPL